ncbi:alpha/beta hydrolase [Spirosoma aureum]|uniref:Alpha/beta hydrolase n=1 Tax=Spirosoma aureum TaxID=2692134 RepID=A0A6G9ANH3_9BACT|nr:alpha/beta hydrolase [Spirosoma aureum]QIP13825.1 alpha/beta hydrolase [Spirosoma aureum]
MNRILFWLFLTITSILSSRTQAQVKNIVLVHGAFADGSGYQKLYTILKSHGYKVSIVGNPNTGVEDDLAATKRVLDRQKGPVILVGHSYGGAIITLAGNSPNVVGLVYIAAFSPDEGESLGQLLSSYPVDPKSGILPPVDGYVWYDQAKFHSGFCADLPNEEAEYMYASQVPVAVSAFAHVFKNVAWKTKPTWHIVATEDHSIPPDLERFMGKRTGGTVSEIKGSHVIFIAQPKAVAAIIETAAKHSLLK